MELVAVVAVAENGVLGRGTGVPWSLPAEVTRYRRRVADTPCVVGRRTFESMLGADDLPGSRQVVLSASGFDVDRDGVTVVRTVEEARSLIAEWDVPVVHVLGGAATYAAFRPHLDRLFRSVVHGTHEGEVRFPAWDWESWELLDTESHEGYHVEEWVRVGEPEA